MIPVVQLSCFNVEAELHTAPCIRQSRQAEYLERLLLMIDLGQLPEPGCSIVQRALLLWHLVHAGNLWLRYGRPLLFFFILRYRGVARLKWSRVCQLLQR
jgi:hypothetical protein